MKFTSASKKDSASRVTARIPALSSLKNLKQGTKLSVSFRHKGADYDILFYVNRKNGSTMKTTSWPQGLPAIAVGEVFEVTEAVVEILK
jgi:hypothetical protein